MQTLFCLASVIAPGDCGARIVMAALCQLIVSSGGLPPPHPPPHCVAMFYLQSTQSEPLLTGNVGVSCGPSATDLLRVSHPFST
jgi:hypothetical protein